MNYLPVLEPLVVRSLHLVTGSAALVRHPYGGCQGGGGAEYLLASEEAEIYLD